MSRADAYQRGMAEHLRNSRADIEREAREYARSRGVTLAQAREEVTDAYREGFYEAVSDPHGDWFDTSEELA